MSRYAPAGPATPRRFRCSTIPERPILKRSASISSRFTTRPRKTGRVRTRGLNIAPGFLSGPRAEKTAETLLEVLRGKGYEVVTEVSAFERFWNAGYHQDYYEKTGKAPYCHTYQKRF